MRGSGGVRRVWTDPGLLLWSLGALLLSPFLLLAKLSRYLRKRHPSEISPDRWTLRPLRPELSEMEERHPGPRVVIVAASLGELMLADRLAAAFREARPDTLVTYCVRDPKTLAYILRERPGLSLTTWPFDALPPVARWLERARPDLVVFTERFRFPLWSLGVDRYGARVALANGRSRSRNTPLRNLVRPLYRWQFGAFSAMLMQKAPDYEAARQLAAPDCDVRLTGDLKLEQRRPELPAEVERSLMDWLRPAPALPLVATGSVDDVDEARMAVEAFLVAREQTPCRLLLAPRQILQADAVEAMVREAGLSVSRRSRAPEPADVLLLDTLGELGVAYRVCAAAYVGGSYHPGGGGHNVVEPLLWSVPVAYGMSRGNFEAIQALCEAHGVGTRIADAKDLGAFFVRFVRDEAERARIGAGGAAMVESAKGALAITMDALLPLLPPATASARSAPEPRSPDPVPEA